MLPPTFDTATFFVNAFGGRDAYLLDAWLSWFHKNLQLLSGVLKNGVKFFNFVWRSLVKLHLLTCSFHFGFTHTSFLLCFLLSPFGHAKCSTLLRFGPSFFKCFGHRFDLSLELSYGQGGPKANMKPIKLENLRSPKRFCDIAFARKT